MNAMYLEALFQQIGLILMALNVLFAIPSVDGNIQWFMQHGGGYILFIGIAVMDLIVTAMVWYQASKDNWNASKGYRWKVTMEVLGVFVDIAALVIYFLHDPLHSPISVPILFTVWLALKAIYKLIWSGCLVSLLRGEGVTNRRRELEDSLCMEMKSFVLLGCMSLGIGFLRLGGMEWGGYVAIAGMVVGLITTIYVKCRAGCNCLGSQEEGGVGYEVVASGAEEPSSEPGAAPLPRAAPRQGAAVLTPAVARTPAYKQKRGDLTVLTVESPERVRNGGDSEQSPRNSSSDAFFTPPSPDRGQTRELTANAEQFVSAAAPPPPG